MALFFDTHAHLDYPDYAPDLAEVVARAQAAGITKIISIGTSLESSERAIRLAEKFPAVYAAVGWHPTEALTAPDDLRPALRQLAKHPKVVAIGETGLDYHHLPSQKPESWSSRFNVSGDKLKLELQQEDTRYKEKQADIFRQQMEVAAEFGMNCIIHQRAAWDDTIAQMRPFIGRTRGVFHCFGETVERMKQVFETRLDRQLHRHRHFQECTKCPRRRRRRTAGQIHAGDRLSVSRAGALSRQTLRTGLCEGNFRNGRADQNVFA